MTVENKEIEKIIQEILLTELDLPESYGSDSNGFIIPSIYIAAPDVALGKTDSLQIGIRSIGSQIISNTKREEQVTAIVDDDEISILQEVREVVVNDNIQIDIKSRNTEARLRRFEVLSALESTYSKQKQDEYKCRIFQIPRGFINTMAAEGSTTIYRWTATIAVQYMRTYTRQIDFYDKFPVEASVDTNSLNVLSETFEIVATSIIGGL